MRLILAYFAICSHSFTIYVLLLGYLVASKAVDITDNTVLLPGTSNSSLYTLVTLAVILPRNDRWLFSLARVVPALQVAVQRVERLRLLPDVRLQIRYADSACSPVRGPLRAFDMRERAGVFLGPFCDYSLSPVARYAAVWDKAVVTPGGMAHDFGADKLRQFRTLTRVGVTFNSLAWSLYSCIRRATQVDSYSTNGGSTTKKPLSDSPVRRVKVLYTPDGHGEVVARFCYLAVSAFVRRLKNSKGLQYHLFLFRPATDFAQMFRDEVGLKYSG